MKRMAIVILSAALLFATSTATALRITDSSTADKGAGSTYSSLNKINTISTAGYQNTYGVPVGMIVAWSSQREISSYDSMKWLECNGQTFNRDQYPELYEALGVNRVPNLNGQFLRGTTSASSVLTYKEDTIKSHEITVPSHTHAASLTIPNRTVNTLEQNGTISVLASSSSSGSGSGSGSSGCLTESEASTCYSNAMDYSDGSMINENCKRIIKTTTSVLQEQGTFTWQNNNRYTFKSGSSFSCTGIFNPTSSGGSSTTTTTSRSIPNVTSTNVTIAGATISTGSSASTISESGDLTGRYDGAEETAPKHTYVRYFIRAIP